MIGVLAVGGTLFGQVLYDASVSRSPVPYPRTHRTPNEASVADSYSPNPWALPDFGAPAVKRVYRGPKTISVQELQHEPSKKAVKELNRAREALRKGNESSNEKHLLKAIKIDPMFLEARNDLGSHYVRLKAYDKAIQQFETIIKDYPHAPRGYHNLSVTYMLVNRFEDAGRAAKQAMDLDPSATRERMLLGLSLVLRNKFTDEAVDYLRQSKAEFPNAQVILARALAGRGETRDAIQELESYLATTSDNTGRAIATQWLSMLKVNSAAASVPTPSTAPSDQP
jgi:Flp pilus assembly protein TadD